MDVMNRLIESASSLRQNNNCKCSGQSDHHKNVEEQ